MQPPGTLPPELVSLAALAELLPDLVLVWSDSQRLLYVNAAVTKLGVSREHAIGKHLSELLHPDDLPRTLATRTDRAIEHAPIEVRLRRDDGSYRWIEHRLFLLEVAGKVVPVNIAQDVQLRREAAERLFSDRQEAPEGDSSEGFIIFGPKGEITAWNQTVLDMLNMPASVLESGDPVRLTAHVSTLVADLDAYRKSLPRLARVGFSEIQRVLLKDGRTLERTVVVSKRDAVPAAISVVVYRDVSTRVEDERRLLARAREQSALARLSQRALENVSLEQLCAEAVRYVVNSLETATAWVAQTTPTGFRMLAALGTLRVNDVGRALTDDEMSLSAATVKLGKPIVLPDVRVDARYPSMVGTGFVSGAEVPITQRGQAVGVLGAFRNTFRPLDPEDIGFLESVANVIAAFLDRETATRALRKSEDSFRKITEHSPDVIIVHRAGRILYTNPSALKAIGLSQPEEAIGRELVDFMDTELRAMQERAKLMRAGGPLPPAEVLLKGVAGQRRTLEVISHPIDYDGQQAIMGIGRDVTERRELHLKLQLADRLASMGTLAAGVAHELNNPLAYVSANLSFIDDQLRDLLPKVQDADPHALNELRTALREAQEGADRVALIVRDLRGLARGSDEQRVHLDLLEVLRSTAKMAQSEIRQRARLVMELEPTPTVLGNPARLSQVFLNLLINAAQAIPPGDASHHEVKLRSGRMPDGQAFVAVSDSGTGISPEVLPRIFDPFFTTKPVGVGTGLGLSVSHAIVMGMSGAIDVLSEPGQGTTFTVRLPASQGAIVSKPPRAEPASHPIERRRILVVDDEPLVAAAVQRALQSEHDVVVVHSGQAVLNTLRAGGKFDGLVSDLLMPEMSGMELHRTLQSEEPLLARRTVFVTGGAFTESARSFLANPGLLVLEKPFELDRLRAAVRESLQR